MSINLALTVEEFAAKRRKAQDEFIDRLLPFATSAISDLKDGLESWDADLIRQAERLYEVAYGDEGGDHTPRTTEFIASIRKALDKTTPESSAQNLAVWLAVAIINSAAIQAAQDDSEELFIEWVTMHDTDVRTAHRLTEGQQRPIGEPFNVDGTKMMFPGDSTAPIELWINCRCTVRPVLASEALTAGGTMPEDTQVGDYEAVPWHGVLAPEDVRSGDGRKFAKGSLSHRDLPLPLTWQKISDDGHKGNITVAKIENVEMIDGQMHAFGSFLQSPEADEVMGLLAEFGKFGVSVDADTTTFELDEDEETVVFTSARVASACIVPIPAFAEAWVALGKAPWMKPEQQDENGEPVSQGNPQADTPVAVRPDAPAPPTMPKKKVPVKSALEQMQSRIEMDWDDIEQFVDVAPGRTEDGPGWLTHPVDTDRLRDYWVRGPGAAKIGWGAPGDFNRCRMQVAKYIKPQFLNGYCANRHFDALGFWPGRPVAGDVTPFAAEVMGLKDTEPAEAVSLVASAASEVERYPAAWFTMAEPDADDPRVVTDAEGNNPGIPLTVTKDGQVYGHVALWGSCHTGNPEGLGVCTTPPQSMSNYREFHVQAAALDNGTTVPAGVLTVGGGHAGLRMGLRAAREHYDDVSTAAAHVVATDGAMGIWVCGSVTPWATAAQIAMLRSTPLSGDWRSDRLGNPEMIAAHAVNTPGFPIPRMQVAASGQSVTAMVASTGPAPVEEVTAEFDMQALAVAVAAEFAAIQARKQKMTELAVAVNGETSGV